MFFKKNKYFCKAAEYSLLFQPSGEVLSCHYNRGYILGNYPENSIDEIWNGKSRQILIKKIRKANFHKTCEYCKTAIKLGYYNKSGINKYDFLIEGEKFYPSNMEFQLDNICNLECIMCSGEYSSRIRKYREKGSPYISPYDDNFVNQLKQYIPHLKQVSFTGGEPFLFNTYYKIWDIIKEKNPDMQIFISTNGTVLNNKVKTYLDYLNFNFTISIDSMNKHVYEKIRRNAILEKTMENIYYFIEYTRIKNLVFNIKSLVAPFNYKDIGEVCTFCNRNQINFIPKTIIIPAFGNFSFSPVEEIKDAINILETYILKSTIQNQIETNNIKRLEEIIDELKNILKTRNQNFQKFDSFTNKQLQQILKKSILRQSDIITKYNKIDIEEKIDYIINSIQDENKLRKSLIAFLSIPPTIIASELNRKEIKKLAERFKQCSNI